MVSILDPPRAVRALAAYWLANPLASDTADGVHRWWLSPGFGFTLHEVDAALAWLVDKGFVLATRGADGRVRYRRNAAATTSELDRLAEPERDPPPKAART